MKPTVLFKVTAVLWAGWGLFHLLGGVGLMSALRGGVDGLPATVAMGMMGETLAFHVTATLAEHGFNNAWFGLVVTLGSVGVWRGRSEAVRLCAVVGGMAHLGFTIFIVAPGHAPPAGVALTAIVAVAVALGFVALGRAERAPEPA